MPNKYAEAFFRRTFTPGFIFWRIYRHTSNHRFLPARRYASVVLAVIVCSSICTSFIRRYCIKTAKHRTTQTTPYDPGTLVFWRQQLLLVGDPPFSRNLRSKWPTPFWTQQFQSIFAHSASGRLKMREWKMRYGQNCKGGKYGSGNSRSKSFGTPNRDYFERILSYLNLVR